MSNIEQISAPAFQQISPSALKRLEAVLRLSRTHEQPTGSRLATLSGLSLVTISRRRRLHADAGRTS